MRVRLTVFRVAFVVLIVAPATPRAQAQTMADVLKNAAGYLADFQKQLSSIVSEETYVQEISPIAGKSSGGGPTQRITLKSDLLFVKPEGADRYVEFRDVFEANGSAVRARGQRLIELLRQPWATAEGKVAAIINESARYNIGAVQRNVNTPLLAMSFLDPALQRHFEFKRASKERAQLAPQGGATPAAGAPAAVESTVFRASTEMWAIEYREKERPTIIRTPDGRAQPVRGRFWINPATGAVLISEMVLDSGGVNTTITVSYQSEPLLGFLVPVEMREVYIASRERIAGTATYDRFRQVQQ